MHILKNVLIYGLFLLIGLVLILQPDDDLDPETVALLGPPPESRTNSAWFYLNAIGAPVGSDLLALGRENHLAFIQAHHHRLGTRQKLDLTQISDLNELPMPEGDIHCDLDNRDCIATVLKSRQTILSELNKHKELLNRYKKFTSMRNLETMVPATQDAPYPNIQYIIEGNRLFGLEAIARALDDDNETAYELLVENEWNIRALLADADDLLIKSLLYFALSENIDYMAITNQLTDFNREGIKPLTITETNIDRPLARELRMMNDTVESIYYKQDHASIGYHIVKPIMKAVAKPNMCTNLMRHAVEQQKTFSRLSHAQFLSGLDKPININYGLSDVLRNSVCTYISRLGFDTRNYTAKGFEANAKILLYNHVRDNHTDSLDDIANSFVNPYYEEKGHAFVVHADGKVCFSAPYDEFKNNRCIVVLDTSSADKNYAETKAE